MSYLQGLTGPCPRAVRFTLGGGEIGAVPVVASLAVYQKYLMPVNATAAPIRFNPKGGAIKSRPQQATWDNARWVGEGGRHVVFWRGPLRGRPVFHVYPADAQPTEAETWNWSSGMIGNRAGYK